MAVNGAESEEEELMVILHACSVGRADVLSNAVSSLKSKYSIPQVADLVGALRSEEGEGVLHICAAKGYSDAIRLLLNLGLDPALRILRRRAYEVANQAARKTFFSYLLEKIAMEDVSAVERLLLGGVEVIFEDESALCWACAFGSETTVGLLLAFTEDVNFREKTEGNTALHIACKHNYTSIAKLLLWKNAAALDVRNKNGELPINKVSENNEELKLLLQSPSSSSECNHEIVQAAALKMKELLERDVLNDAEENARVRAALQEAGFISNDNDDEEEEEEEEEEGKEESPSSSGTSAGGKDTTIHPSIDAAAPTVTISYVKKDLFLWPFPQRYEFTELEPLLLPISQPLVLCVLSKTVDILPLLRGSGFLDLFERLHMAIEVQRLSSAAKVRLAVDSNLCPGINRYLLSVTSTAISITASDTAGFMHGLQALTQYLQIYAEAFSLKSISYIKVPTIDISDWPDVLQRAVLWSFNETSLSSFSLLSSLVELLSKLRINRLLLLLRNDDMNGLSPQTSADIEVEEVLYIHWLLHVLLSFSR